ncbi:MAG: hypothetical protein ACN4GR_01695 [Arenicellales bacterium]
MHIFKGFNDWIEIFRGGVQTNSAGVSKDWTNDDLDEIVANHSSDNPAPAVIGHPKTDAPAYGWTSGLKRVGNTLLAKFNEIEPAFEENVKAGRYKKRSVAIVPADDGTYKLRHVGWLGAMAPAVDNLKNPTFCGFADDENDVMLFEADWYTPSLLSQALRRIRDWIISENDLKTANEVIPEYMIESAKSQSDSVRNSETDEPQFTGHLMSHPSLQSSEEDKAVPNEDKKVFSQADIDAAVAAANEASEQSFSKQNETLQADLEKERNQNRVAEFQATVDTAVNEGRLVPAMAVGMAEFMAALPEGDDAEFTFSAGDDKDKKEVKKSQAAYFSEFLDRLPKAFASLFNEQAGGDSDAGDAQASSFKAPEGYAIDAEAQAIHTKALEYQATHENVSYLDAVVAVDQ